jgi:zinc resistance-associated protein
MLKALLAGTTALAIAGASVAFAQQPTPQAPQAQTPQAGQSAHEGRQHWRPSEQDANALTDARIAAIKAGLKLTPEQEKNWPAVEQAIRDMARDRYQRRTERQGQRQADPIERLRTRADAMTKTAADLKKLADAADPLYKSLNDDQKHRLHYLVRSMRGHRMAMHGHEHRGFERD